MAGNLKSTDSTLRLIQPQTTAQVSFPSARLEQYTCDSHPPNLIYEVGSKLHLYSQGIPCNSIPANTYFHIPHVQFLNLVSQKTKFTWFFSVFSCVCLPISTFSLKTGQWLISVGTQIEIIPTFGQAEDEKENRDFINLLTEKSFRMRYLFMTHQEINIRAQNTNL